MNILFIDMCCSEPYNDASLERGIGGSEASVIRLTAALRAAGHTTVVVQHNRDARSGRFARSIPDIEFDHIVVLRDPFAVENVRKLFPEIPITLWVHDSAAPHAWGSRIVIVVEHKPYIVVPSAYQRSRMSDIARMFTGKHYIEKDEVDDLIRAIPNIVDANIEFSKTSVVNINKVLYASDPARGLARAIIATKLARDRGRPDLKLHVCRPSYCAPLDIDEDEEQYVVDLGVLPHAGVLAEMATSMCLLYPNNSVPECFGLVMAEANAVGCPVIAHDIGAAREVLLPAEPQLVSEAMGPLVERLVDFTHPARVRLHVALKSEFVTSNVVGRWLSHFTSASRTNTKSTTIH